MKSTLSDLGTKVLRLMDPEAAHHLGMKLLQSGGLGLLPETAPDSSRLQTHLGKGTTLAHPVGLAAGFDKNALCPESFHHLGFSFVEVGTFTPKPQDGNPKPRLFRYPEHRTLVNRMGFNNDGAEVIKQRLEAKPQRDFTLGINIGKNKATSPENALDDYLSLLDSFKGLEDYFVVNVSSPNTPGLRKLASPEFLKALAQSSPVAMNRIWVKFDPDMEPAQLQSLVEALVTEGYGGVILSNTHRVETPEAGGLSGTALSLLSARCLEIAWEVHRGELQTVGCGGILSGADILQKILRGAHAVQIYTALVYRGPWVVHRLLDELRAEMDLLGFSSLQEAHGKFYSL